MIEKYLKPDVDETLRVRVAKRDEDRQQYIQEVIEVVKQAMTENGLQGKRYLAAPLTFLWHLSEDGSSG